MIRRLVLVVSVLLIGSAESSAFAQVNRGANPLQYNNPLAQAGMYGGSSVLRYNNPMNQVGMYNMSPVLRYNNPLAQAGMYNNAPWLQYNNPLVQGNMYGVGGGYQRGRTSAVNGAGVNVRRRNRGQNIRPAARTRTNQAARASRAAR